MRNKFFILFASMMIFIGGSVSNVLASENIKLSTPNNVCSTESINPYLACCLNPDLVFVSSTTQVCKNCGRVIQW